MAPEENERTPWRYPLKHILIPPQQRVIATKIASPLGALSEKIAIDAYANSPNEIAMPISGEIRKQAALDKKAEIPVINHFGMPTDGRERLRSNKTIAAGRTVNRRGE